MSEGCKYCLEGETIAWDLCNDAVYIDTDGKIHILTAGDWECQINYCPMCGRRLNSQPQEAKPTKNEAQKGGVNHGRKTKTGPG